MRKHIWKTLVAFTGAVAMAGCLGGAPTGPGAGGPGGDPGAGGTGGTGEPGGTGGTGGTGEPAGPTEDPRLSARVVDYGHAARTAAIKLVGALPTMDEIASVKDAASYAALVDKYLADPRFPAQIQAYFRDMMKMGGNITVRVGNQNVQVSLDTAPTFAARLAVEDKDLNELFTATANTCPTLDRATGQFTDGDCAVANGLTTAGVLTDPGAMAQFYGNMAFRRVRWVQETFVCTKFPAEFSTTPVQKGAGQYVAPWEFESITGGANAPIDFHDTSAVVCANCHVTMNHMAPLFANFNEAGVFQNSIQVRTPTPQMPISQLTDWLPAGQPLAWRFNKTVTNLTELGQAIAADPDVASCHVFRAWNWAMSKTDIVNDLAIVPKSVTAALEQEFLTNGRKLKPLIRAIFTSDDFVKF